MTCPRLLLLVLLCLSTLASTACGSSSPTGPSPPASDAAAQFDSLWNTFDREYSYFIHKQIDWSALRSAYRPRAIEAADQTSFIDVIREMLGHLHDMHVVIRDPGGRSIPTYDPQAFVNWDRSVWQQYIARAGWTQGQNDWGYGVLDGVPYITIGGWGASSIRSADFDVALERFRNAPAIILDVRMNPGGNDALAFEVAGRFARTSVVFGSVRFRNGPSHSDFGPATDAHAQPARFVAVHRAGTGVDGPSVRQQQRELHRRDGTAAERDARRRSHGGVNRKPGHVPAGERMVLHRVTMD